MRLMMIALLFAAASAFAQAQPESETKPAPTLVTSTQIQPGDSALVQAAKRAMAARQKSGQRVVSVTPNKGGHLFQATGPVNVSFKMPPDEKKAPAPMRRQYIDVTLLEQKLKKLQEEEQRLGAQGDEPVGGEEGEEDGVDARLAYVRKEIADVRKQIEQAKASNARQQ